MEPQKLIKYEMPALAEFISIDWLQDIIASYIAFKVRRKLRRYNYRIEGEKWLKQRISNQ